MDASEEQMKQCKPHPRITFRKGCAEDTGLPDDSIDLLTAATALHWYDFCLTSLSAACVIAGWTGVLLR
jgi:ubiquinone/menaquinone biosynthesis C-methylase UbiE